MARVHGRIGRAAVAVALGITVATAVPTTAGAAEPAPSRIGELEGPARPARPATSRQAGLATPAAAQLPPITARVLTGPEGVEVISADHVTERGHVLVSTLGGPDSSLLPGVWVRGRLQLLPPSPPGTGPVVATDMSEDDQVVGGYFASGICGPPPFPLPCPRPFAWSGGDLISLPVPEGEVGYAVDVNGRGQIAGSVGTPDGSRSSAVVWEDGELAAAPARHPNAAAGINERGQVLLVLDVDGAAGAAVWQVGGDVIELGTLGGQHTRPQVINERGHVAGIAQTPDGTMHAFLWRGGELIDLGVFGLETDEVVALNDRDQVVVTGYTPDGQHAYLWDGGQVTDLGPIYLLGGSVYGGLTDSNDRGQIVGGVVSDVAIPHHATLWHGGQRIDLHSLVPGVGTDTESTAKDVSERGQIAGEVDGKAVLWTVHRR